MRTNWTLEEAQVNLAEIIQQARHKPQVIGVGEDIFMVTYCPDTKSQQPLSAWEALRGNFDFSDMGDEDLFERIKDDDRDIEW